MIADAFASAGYGKMQQVAAVANAIAESSLDPTAVGDGGNSWVYFKRIRTAGSELIILPPALRTHKQISRLPWMQLKNLNRSPKPNRLTLR